MKQQLFLILLIVVIVFLSGCAGKNVQTASGVGLSNTLTSDVKKAETSMPVTFMLTIKNMASESATDISTELTNLTGWKVENALQHLNKLMSSDLYKFSWLAYAPSVPNKTFSPTANLFYKMQTKANLKIRVYENDYLNTLKQKDRQSIMGKSALLSSNISKSTPVNFSLSLQQPFILTEYSQNFPFVIEIKINNAILGQVYKDDESYKPRESWKNYVRFGYTTNSTMVCDFSNGDVARLVDGSRSIACKLTATQDRVNNYTDFAVNFTISYTYLDKASTGIEVV